MDRGCMGQWFVKLKDMCSRDLCPHSELNLGYDSLGAEQLGRKLVDTTKWIGTAGAF